MSLANVKPVILGSRAEESINQQYVSQRFPTMEMFQSKSFCSRCPEVCQPLKATL